MSSLFGNRGPTGSFGANVTPKGYSSGQVQQFTPQQMKLFQSMFSQVSPGSQLSRLASGDESQFAQMEAPALRQFGELQGNIASRFSGQGLGGRHGSGFQNTMSAASSNFAQELQSRRMELQRQALMDLMGISESLLGQRPFEKFLVKQKEREKRKSFLEQLLGGAAPIAGGAIGGALGGPLGAMAGGGIGSAFGQAFR